MRELAPGLHVHEAPQRFFGLEVGSRMTLLDTGHGWLVHSPVACEPELLAGFGRVRWLVAPNKLHHLHVGPWLDRGVEGWAAPGLPEKRPDLAFAGVLGEQPAPFGEAVGVHPLGFFPLANEVVLHHRPTGTLIVTDLVFHFTSAAPVTTRAALALSLGYPGCRTTLLERALFDRPVAREQIGALLELDFDRLVMAHGEVIETGGREALRRATHWLW